MYRPRKEREVKKTPSTPAWSSSDERDRGARGASPSKWTHNGPEAVLCQRPTEDGGEGCGNCLQPAAGLTGPSDVRTQETTPTPRREGPKNDSKSTEERVS